jgi:hypothetical protein
MPEYDAPFGNADFQFLQPRERDDDSFAVSGDDDSFDEWGPEQDFDEDIDDADNT